MKTYLMILVMMMALGSPIFPQHYWQLAESGTIKNLNGIDFITTETGVAVGNEGTIIYTTNGGVSWIPAGVGVSADLRGVAFASNEKIVAVGEMGIVLLSVNQGQTWQQISIPNVEYDLFDVSFDVASGHGVITGQTNSIIVSGDFGETWTVVNDGYMSTFFGASMVNSNMGIVVGWNSVFQPLIGYTLDWQTWDYQNFYPTWGGVYYEGVARAAKFTDANHGFIVGDYFVPGGGFLAPFGGWGNNAWEALSFPQPLTCIDFINSFGVVAGDNTFLSETQDGGQTWETINLNIGNTAFKDLILIGNTGYIAGDGGTILKMISTVSVEPIEKHETVIFCYPNPATAKVFVNFPFQGKPCKISFYDFAGILRLIKTLPENAMQATIPVEHLPRGIYTFTVETSQERYSGMVVLI